MYLHLILGAFVSAVAWAGSMREEGLQRATVVEPKKEFVLWRAILFYRVRFLMVSIGVAHFDSQRAM